MTDNPIIKIMKLSSGEEIVSTLIDDSNPRTFNVQSPLKLQSVPKMTEYGIEESISLTRWMHFAEETNVDVPKTQVLGVATASVGLSRFYDYCLKKMNTESDIGEEPTDRDLDSIEEAEWEEEFDSYDTPSKVYH